jgi:hypothetical protein
VTDEPIVTDEDVERFLRAVHEEGEHSPDGVVHAAKVMGRMDLQASSLLDLAHNPTTGDDKLYKGLGRYCKGQYLIESKDDRYVWVKITDSGKQYLGV